LKDNRNNSCLQCFDTCLGSRRASSR